MEKRKGYISGPISSNPDGYKEKFSRAEQLLKGMGFEVINPARDDFTEAVKKAGIQDIWSPEAWLWYIKRDMDIVSKCDVIYMLDGWERSPGAAIEKATAEKFKLEVMYEKSA